MGCGLARDLVRWAVVCLACPIRVWDKSRCLVRPMGFRNWISIPILELPQVFPPCSCSTTRSHWPKLIFSSRPPHSPIHASDPRTQDPQHGLSTLPQRCHTLRLPENTRLKIRQSCPAGFSQFSDGMMHAALRRVEMHFHRYIPPFSKPFP